MGLQLLKDENIYPDENILKELTGKLYLIYEELMISLKNEPFNLISNWNYYKDGKAWLCKVEHKKKTVFWLSFWEDSFKITFYFTEKTEKNIYQLNIDSELKNEFKNSKIIGKLKPLTINVNNMIQKDDILKIVEYKKMNLK